MNEWLVLGGVTALLATVWRHLKDWFQRFRSLFLVQVTLESYLASTVLPWLEESGKRFSTRSPNPTFMNMWLFFPTYRQGQEPTIAAAEMLRTGWRAYWLEGWLVIYSTSSPSQMEESYANNAPRSSSNDGKQAVTLLTLRGRFTAEDLVTRLLAWATDKRDALEDNQRSSSVEEFSPFIARHYGTYYADGERIRSAGGESAPPTTGNGNNVNRAQEDNLPFILNDLTQGCYRIYDRHGRSTTGRTMPVNLIRPFDRMSLPEGADEVLAAMEFWRWNEEWFRARGIPWRMGVALIGPPGTGKTTCADTFARHLRLPICIPDMSTMDNQDLAKALQTGTYTGHGPDLTLIEDIDGIFEQRRTVRGGVTFDGFLNAIDGVDRRRGRLLVITTNRPELLDDALCGGGDISRPGRIDMVLHFTALTEAGRTLIASRILQDWPEILPEIVAAGTGETGAVFEARCLAEARQQIRTKISALSQASN